jgi:hypothetical protein
MDMKGHNSFLGGCAAPIIGPVGWFVNGVSLFGLHNGNSINNVWQNIALEFEWFDLDVCLGHASLSSNGVTTFPYHRKLRTPFKRAFLSK